MTKLRKILPAAGFIYSVAALSGCADAPPSAGDDTLAPGASATPVSPAGDCVPGPAPITRHSQQVPGHEPWAACAPDKAVQRSQRLLHPETGNGWSWSVPATAAAGVTGAPALYYPNYPSENMSQDALFVGSATSRGPNLFALGSLYTTPSITWSVTTAGIDGSWVDMDLLGQVYALDTAGTLWCSTAAGSQGAPVPCSLWPAQSFATNEGSSLSSPWFDSLTSSVFIATLAGKVHKIGSTGSGNGGAEEWTASSGYPLSSALSGSSLTCGGSTCPTFPIRGTPLVINHNVYVGNDAGAFCKLTDAAGTAPSAASCVFLCNCTQSALGGTVTCTNNTTATTGCGAPWSVLTSPTLDTTTNELYVAANGKLFEFNVAASPFKPSNILSLGTSGYPVYSSPIVDPTNHFVYVGYNNQLHKAAYPFSSKTVDVTTQLAGQGPDPSYPHSSAIQPFSGANVSQLFIGDGAGNEEGFGCLGLYDAGSPDATPPAAGLLGAATVSGAAGVNASPVADIAGGDLYFGFTATTASGTGGGAVQMAQTTGFACPANDRTCSSYCGDNIDGGATTVCVPATGCCVASDCPSNGTYQCINNACVLSTCGSGSFACHGSCYSGTGGANSCCIQSDCATGSYCNSSHQCATDPGPTGIPAFTFTVPRGLNIASVQGQIYVPSQTVTLPSAVTFTHTTSGTSQTISGNFSQFPGVAGQSLSLDGTNWYEVTAFSSSSITIMPPYSGETAVVTSYIESDCLSASSVGQNCTYTQSFGPISEACTGTGSTPCVTASTSFPLQAGVYAIKAYGVDSSGTVHAANTNANKFYVTGNTTTDAPLSGLSLALTPVYPVGTGASCPSKVSVNARTGDIWTMNATPLGYTGTACPGASNNVSYLQASNSTQHYSPTVYANLGGTPTGIAATSDSTNEAWVTTTEGLYSIHPGQSALAANRPSTAIGCTTPSDVEIDVTYTLTLGNPYDGAFVTCYGTDNPDDNSRQLLRFANADSVGNSGTAYASYYFNSRIAQPLAVRFGHAFGPTAAGTPSSGNPYDLYDDEGAAVAYVTLSQPGGTFLSGLNVSGWTTTNASLEVATTRVSLTDDGPFTMGIDGFGTMYSPLYTPATAGNPNLYNEQWVLAEGDTAELVNWEENTFAPPTFAIAVDDNYLGSQFIVGRAIKQASAGNIYVASGPNTIVRYSNSLATVLNTFVVGTTSNAGALGIAYDFTGQKIWVANSNEGTLSAIGRDLFVFANDDYQDGPSPSGSCFTSGTGTVNSAETVTGEGFDTTTPTNNTILVAGYLANSATAGTSGNANQPNAVQIKLPNRPGTSITGPVTVTNQLGTVVSVCKYTY
jgi:hypothetical protein